MIQFLPQKNFKFINSFNVEHIFSYNCDHNLDYIFDVDLEYSKNLHDIHNYFLLLLKIFQSLLKCSVIMIYMIQKLKYDGIKINTNVKTQINK